MFDAQFLPGEMYVPSVLCTDGNACLHVCMYAAGVTAILVSASTDGSAQVTRGHGNSIPMKLAYYKSSLVTSLFFAHGGEK